jgi:SAM-dependent methyltransferase
MASTQNERSAAVPISTGSPERFGYSWQNYSEILPEHEQQFARWTSPLQREDWKGVTFLDVGCGIGRNSYWALEYGADAGLAIDVDERTLAAARRNLGNFENLEIRFQSVYDLSDTDRFDIVYSIGVVHHLEFPELAVRKMMEAAKPGGRVLVWLYGYENNEWIVRGADPIRKALFSKMPLGLVHALSLPLAWLLWVALRLGFAPIEFFRMARGFTFPHLRAIIFDHMIPKIARYYRREEAADLLRNAGLKDVGLIWVNEMSWAVSGVKPIPAD